MKEKEGGEGEKRERRGERGEGRRELGERERERRRGGEEERRGGGGERENSEACALLLSLSSSLRVPLSLPPLSLLSLAHTHTHTHTHTPGHLNQLQQRCGTGSQLESLGSTLTFHVTDCSHPRLETSALQTYPHFQGKYYSHFCHHRNQTDARSW